MADITRFFSGHESWVFRARAPGELCGHHPDLIGQVLTPGECVDYLLYSPLREVDGASFGIMGPSASHALAVTSDRFIISRDPHDARRSRTVREVPFADILCVEIGEALTLGWLVVHFAVAGTDTRETIFFQSSGIEHFRAAVRAWRERISPRPASARSDDAWARIWADTPPYLRTQMAPLLLDDEQPEDVRHRLETWTPSAQGRPSECASPASLRVLTNHALLIAESERPPRRGTLVFAVNVRCADRRGGCAR